MSRESAPAERRWRLPFGWVGLALLGCVIYELTQSPAMGSVLVCLKFGWEDFLAARWLWRRDGDRWRRSAVFWLYFAWGLWKTALVAFFMSTAFAAVAQQAGAPAAGPAALRAFVGTFALTLLAFGLSALMTFLALFCAWYGRTRLWLDAAVHRARRHDDWPPTPWCDGRRNRLGHLVLTALALGLVALLVPALLVAIPGGPMARAFSVAASVAAPGLLVLGNEIAHRHVWAYRPRQCWPDEAEPAPTPGDPER